MFRTEANRTRKHELDSLAIHQYKKQNALQCNALIHEAVYVDVEETPQRPTMTLLAKSENEWTVHQAIPAKTPIYKYTDVCTTSPVDMDLSQTQG